VKPPQEMFAAAVQCHREGRLEEAERLYRQVLAADPGHADSLHRLGVMAHQQGRNGMAVDLLRRAIARAPETASYHAHLGLALGALDCLEEAIASCQTAMRLDPSLPDLHNNLGVLAQRRGWLDKAASCYREAARLAPQLVEAHNNLGHVLLELGRLQEAEGCYRRVMQLMPGVADGPANLGVVLKFLGRFEEAATCFQRALVIAPAEPEILGHLALTHLALGDRRTALATVLRSLAVQETPGNRRVFVQCVKDLKLDSEIAGVRPLVLRALEEGWGSPDDLARVSADLIKQSPDLASDRLLQALLCRTPNRDLELEALLTAARRHLLRDCAALPGSQADTALAFPCALARQCFINEYVFALDADEAEQARQLRDGVAVALEQGASVDSWSIAAVAAYFPLTSLPHAARLLQTAWPDEVEALLTQQIREPEEENVLRAAIPRLTDVEDSVSRLVRSQYEENPYPRWGGTGSAGPPQPLLSWLRRTFPFAPVEDPGRDGGIDILVAGCGTGRNAIETARMFTGARTIGIDLSLNSLAHAARKTRDLGITGIEYAQADLMELGSWERRFDLIEAVGVLHHLGDPFAGWRGLLSLLKPKGFMMLGIYSLEGRRDLPDMAASTADEIRQARQSLIAQGSAVTERMDFFSTSTCRDLLFHVQEHRLSLVDIGAFLRTQNLKFLGFSAGDAVLAAYRQRFPDDPAAADLDHWQVFEKDNPDTFSGMYQFWLQKAL